MKGSPLRGGGRSTPTKKKLQQQQQQQQDDSSNDEEDSNVVNFIHPNLGPPWEIKEVSDFFNIAKKSEPDWRLVSKKFPNRTEEMLKQLYKISKPISNYNTPEFLLFFIQGVYRISQIEQPQQQQPPPPPPQQQQPSKLPPHHSQLQQLQLLKQQREQAQREQQNQQSPTKTSSKGRTIYDNNTFGNNSNNSNSNNNNNNSFNSNNTYSIENLGQNNNGRPKARRLFPPSDPTTTTTTTTTTTATTASVSTQYDSPSKRKTNNKELSLGGDISPTLPAKLRGKLKQGKIDAFSMSPNSLLNSNNNRINNQNNNYNNFNNNNSQSDSDDDNDDHKHLLEFQRSNPNTPQRQQSHTLQNQFTPHQQMQPHFQNILQSPTLEQIQTNIDDNSALVPSKENQNLIQKRLVNFLSNQKQPNPKSNKSISPSINNINEDSSSISTTLSKPGRWATYEWFYSDLDTPFFFYNEFQIFIHQLHLPKKLTRMEWNEIRSGMRKPRRLSQQFYFEARHKLDKTRETVRQSMINNDSLKFLQIEPNSKVLYIYKNSLENGKVVSYNRISKTYSIISDKTNKVIEIPDEEVMSADKDVRYCIEQSHLQSKEKNNSNDNSDGINKNKININNNNSINIVNNSINNNNNYNNSSSISNKNTPYKRKFEDLNLNKTNSPNRLNNNSNNNININNSNNNNVNSNSTVLTHSDQVVTLVVGLSEVLERKQNLLSKIHEMNEEAKSMVISGFPVEFQKRYSELLISIEYHNSILQTLLEIFRKNNYSRRISKVDEYQTNDKKTLIPELIELYKNKSEEFINNVDKESLHQQQHQIQFRELKDENLKKLLNSIMSFIFHIKNQSVNIELSKEDIDFIFNYCLDQIRPKSAENLDLFKEIEKSIEFIKNKIKSCKTD